MLIARIAELERQIGLNSSTSSKPPSSDGYQKEPRRTESLRDQTPKLRKSPKERERTHLEACETPDRIMALPPLHQCPCCQKDIADIPSSGVVKRQVFDIPEPKLEVTEYQGEVKVCSCGKTVSNFPAHVQAPVQYGSRLKSMAVYLSNQHLIPEDRLRQYWQDVHGVSLCKKTLANFNRHAAEALAEDNNHRFATVKASPVKHADETGMRIEGKLQWVHTLCDGQTTHYRVAARGDMPVGVTGILMHDCLGSYDSLKVIHSYCNAHFLRELTAVVTWEEEAWALNISRVLWLSWRAKRDGKTERYKVRLGALYDKCVLDGLAYHESLPPLEQAAGKKGRKKRRVGHNLVRRMRDKKEGILLHLEKTLVPFTNNLAEQDLRMMKVKQKISGSFRTLQGAEDFCVLRGFISTARKQNRNILAALATVFA